MKKVFTLISRAYQGFTLVELLVAVFIVAILTIIGLVVYQDIRTTARDAKRKQDLRTVQTALTIYYQKNSRYPCSSTETVGIAEDWQKSDGINPWWIDDQCSPKVEFKESYISLLPQDPKNSGGYPWDQGGYTYAYWSGHIIEDPQTQGCPAGQSQYYILAAKLEKENDRDRTANTPYYFCNGEEIIGISELIPGEDIEDLFFVTSQD